MRIGTAAKLRQNCGKRINKRDVAAEKAYEISIVFHGKRTARSAAAKTGQQEDKETRQESKRL
ncbi:MAG TPA: hypothetical protein DCE65_00845 [Clostridiales bacterium]|nr:hypothetical protein [Clostridiales bacterium]